LPVVSDRLEPLILDLLEWIGPRPRPYAEVIETWRTSGPRLPVWEDANDRGFVAREHREDVGPVVTLTASGREYLERRRASASRARAG
jgi:hypothetical protein